MDQIYISDPPGIIYIGDLTTTIYVGDPPTPYVITYPAESYVDPTLMNVNRNWSTGINILDGNTLTNNITSGYNIDYMSPG